MDLFAGKAYDANGKQMTIKCKLYIKYTANTSPVRPILKLLQLLFNRIPSVYCNIVRSRCPPTEGITARLQRGAPVQERCPTSPLPLCACALSLIVFAKMALSKTFGQKPIKFQLEQDGDFYMIGSEVCFLSHRELRVCLHLICVSVAIILTL